MDTSVTWDVATQRMFAQTISSEADRLNRFVRNLLEISRLESTHAPRPHTPIEIGDVIAQTVQRLRPVLSQHTVEIRIAPNLPAVPMDAVQIELVLSNVFGKRCEICPAHSHHGGSGVAGPRPPRAGRRSWSRRAASGAGPDLGQVLSGGRTRTRAGWIRLGLGDCERHRGRPWWSHLGGRSTGGGAVFQFTLPLTSASVPIPVSSSVRQAA